MTDANTTSTSSVSTAAPTYSAVTSSSAKRAALARGCALSRHRRHERANLPAGHAPHPAAHASGVAAMIANNGLVAGYCAANGVHSRASISLRTASRSAFAMG